MFEQLKEMGITCERLGRFTGHSGRTVRSWKKKGSPVWAEKFVGHLYAAFLIWKEVRDA